MGDQPGLEKITPLQSFTIFILEVVMENFDELYRMMQIESARQKAAIDALPKNPGDAEKILTLLRLKYEEYNCRLMDLAMTDPTVANMIRLEQLHNRDRTETLYELVFQLQESYQKSLQEILELVSASTTVIRMGKKTTDTLE